MQSLKTSVERLASMGEVEQKPEARKIFLEFRDALTQGKIRAAEKIDGRWTVNAWVKQGILLGFRLGELTEMGDSALAFVDKDTFPARRFTVARSCARGAGWFLGSRRILRCTLRHLHAADVHQRGRLRGRRHYGGFARARRIVRANRQARAL